MPEIGKEDQGDGERAGGLLAITIAEVAAQAKEQPQWSAGDRFATSVAKHKDLSVTVLILRKGALLKEHTARGSISLQVMAGAVRFSAAGGDKNLTPGMLCVLDSEIPHAVEALEESTLLLTAAIAG